MPNIRTRKALPGYCVTGTGPETIVFAQGLMPERPDPGKVALSMQMAPRLRRAA